MTNNPSKILFWLRNWKLWYEEIDFLIILLCVTFVQVEMQVSVGIRNYSGRALAEFHWTPERGLFSPILIHTTPAVHQLSSWLESVSSASSK